MKITKEQLQQITREAINEQGSYGSRRGGYGPVTVRDIERMLPSGVMRDYSGAARILQRRALDAGMSKNDLEDKIKAARIKDSEHPRQFFKRLGFKYDLNEDEMKITKEQLRDIIRETATAPEGRFIIMKSSRALRDGTAVPGNAYRNPRTADKAGVEPGLVYSSREEAEIDAEKLGQVNPMGFVVVRLSEARDLDTEAEGHQVTKSQLRQIVKEEHAKLVAEQQYRHPKTGEDLFLMLNDVVDKMLDAGIDHYELAGELQGLADQVIDSIPDEEKGPVWGR